MAQKEIKPQILQADKVELNSGETLNLLTVITSIINANPMLPPSAAKWIAKNQKKLLSRHEKNTFAEQGLRDKYMEYIMYVEQDQDGHDVFWDGVEDNIVYKDNPLKDLAVNSEKIVDEENSTFGIKAWYDKDNNKLIDLKTQQPISDKQVLAKMKPYVKDLGQRKVYEEKLIEFDKELDGIKQTKHEVHVLKIIPDYLEQARIAIPTTTYNAIIQNKQQLDLVAFYDYLTVSDEEEPSQTNDVAEPKLSVVKTQVSGEGEE